MKLPRITIINLDYLNFDGYCVADLIVHNIQISFYVTTKDSRNFDWFILPTSLRDVGYLSNALEELSDEFDCDIRELIKETLIFNIEFRE